MVATLIPQIKDRTAEVKCGQLSGKELEAEKTRLQNLITGLKDRVEKLPEDQARKDYVKEVDKVFADFDSAKDENHELQVKKLEPETPELQEAELKPEPKVDEKGKEPEPVKHGKKSKS